MCAGLGVFLRSLKARSSSKDRQVWAPIRGLPDLGASDPGGAVMSLVHVGQPLMDFASANKSLCSRQLRQARSRKAGKISGASEPVFPVGPPLPLPVALRVCLRPLAQVPGWLRDVGFSVGGTAAPAKQHFISILFYTLHIYLLSEPQRFC